MATKEDDHGSSTSLREQQKKVEDALKRIAASLKDLDDSRSAPTLSHFRTLPEVVTQAYDLIEQGAQLVHGTSTKYTLLGKLDAKEQTRMAGELLQGCHLVATGCLVLFDDQSGCARSTRHHVKQAARSIVQTVIQLVDVWVEETAQGATNQLGAQKTGAVWEMCDAVLLKKVPRGNRNAMRRDLLTYAMECGETVSEFQEMIDQGPTENGEATPSASEEAWDVLSEGSRYTEGELPLAIACLGLIKSSKGCINLALQAMESVGEQISEPFNPAIDGDAIAKLRFISTLQDHTRCVGDGMTDFGASMYPPLDLDSLQEQAACQQKAIQRVLDCLTEISAIVAVPITLPIEIRTLHTKLQRVLERRATEISDAASAF